MYVPNWLPLYDADAPNSKIDFSEPGGYRDERINMGYLPEGFEVEKTNFAGNTVIAKFRKSELYFFVSIGDLQRKGSVDTEDAVITTVDINGCEAVLVEKEDYCQVLWRDDENSFYVWGTLPKHEIVKIAQNLKKN